MNLDEIEKGLKDAAQMINVCTRVAHLIEHNERNGDFAIATDTLRTVMQEALKENPLKTPGAVKYNQEEFSQFLQKLERKP